MIYLKRSLPKLEQNEENTEINYIQMKYHETMFFHFQKCYIWKSSSLINE